MINLACKGSGVPLTPRTYHRGWYKPGRGKYTDMGFVYDSDAAAAPLPPRAPFVRYVERACHTTRCRPSVGYHPQECPEANHG